MRFLLLFSLAASFLAPDVLGQEGAGGEPSAYEHPFETDREREPALVTEGAALIRNVTVHSAIEPPFVADVLVRDGDIAGIGQGLEVGGDVPVLDGSGKHLAPGVIDTHSHMAIEGGVNEGTLSITADCDITDVIDPDDVGIYRALAGGVTTIQCLHGSANVIGGRSEVLKLRWPARSADELRFPDAPQGIKFALGENPKRSNWGESGTRFPGSRMGVEAVLVRAFTRAIEYRAMLAAFDEARARGEDPVPPRRDVRLDVLVGILDGAVQVHSHCYRADEILMLLRVGERFGFRIQTLQHVLEGYKVASEIAAHGAMTSTFSDWFGYKLEAYDAIPENAALLDEAGVVSTINSDSDELIRHLYHEAAKSVRHAGLDPVRALRLATLNSAIQLGIEDRVGSIEVGKDADLVLLNGDPLSVYSRVEWTMVDGVIEFQRRDSFGLDAEPLVVSSIEESDEVAEAVLDASAPLVAIVGATLHPVTSPVIEGGTLLLQGQRIVAMGAEVSVPESAERIDASGKHLWPGMIAMHTNLGLTEISSVRGSVDTSEIGGSQPDLRVTASIHADSSHIPITRSAGVTRAQVTPGGRGPFLGQSAVIRLAGDTWEELLTLDRDMLHVRFPRTGNAEEDKEEPEEVEELRQAFADAREYGRLVREAREQGVPTPRHDPRLEALLPFVHAEKPVALHADNAQTILYALRFAGEEELDAILVGGRQAWAVAPAIARAEVPVVLGPVLTLPYRFDPYDAPYANAAVLHRAGVRFAITPDDGTNIRNIGYHAGFAAAFGLPREEALRAVTYSPAKLLGLEDELGSLAVGKRADVVMTDGDLFEPTSRILAIWIDGQPQDVGNRQTRLYERYRERMLQKTR